MQSKYNERMALRLQFFIMIECHSVRKIRRELKCAVYEVELLISNTRTCNIFLERSEKIM
jgi:hypothetical protein